MAGGAPIFRRAAPRCILYMKSTVSEALCLSVVLALAGGYMIVGFDGFCERLWLVV